MAVIDKEFEFVRKRHRALMPEHMKEFEIKFRSTVRPKSITLPKREFITSWVEIFDSDDIENIDNRLLQYNVRQLETGFEWTLYNFAELDLGGNHKWHAALLTILKLIKKEEWDKVNQDKIINEYLTDTRWYDY